MLGRDDDRVDALRPAILSVLHRNLALSVGPQPGQRAVLAPVGQGTGEVVRVADRGRHQLLRLVAGEAEHHALIAGAVGRVVVKGAVDAHGDVAGLFVDRGQDGAGIAVEARAGVVVADAADRLASDPGDVHVAVGRDLAHDQHHAGRSGALTGHAGHGILREDCVEHAVGDLVTDLVGMPLGHGF